MEFSAWFAWGASKFEALRHEPCTMTIEININRAISWNLYDRDLCRIAPNQEPTVTTCCLSPSRLFLIHVFPPPIAISTEENSSIEASSLSHFAGVFPRFRDSGCTWVGSTYKSALAKSFCFFFMNVAPSHVLVLLSGFMRDVTGCMVLLMVVLGWVCAGVSGSDMFRRVFG